MEETKKRPELDMALNTELDLALNTIFVIQDPEKGTIMDKKGTDDIRSTVQKVLENKTNKASKPDLVAALKWIINDAYLGNFDFSEEVKTDEIEKEEAVKKDPNEGNRSQVERKKICNKYRQGKCHDKECILEHPQKCRFFCTYGYAKNNDNKKGCKKKVGECPYLHPTLCRQQFKGGCKNKKCTKLHIKNIKNTNNKRSTKKDNKSKKPPEQDVKKDFLDLQNLVKLLAKEVQNDLLRSQKANPGSWQMANPYINSPPMYPFPHPWR